MACRCKPRSDGSDTHRRTAHTTGTVADRSGVPTEPPTRETLGSDERICNGQCPECQKGAFERGAVWFELVCEECGLVVEAREMEYLDENCSVHTRADPAPRTAECGERVEG